MTTIEMTGMVGAGKSTLARGLASDLEALGRRVLDLNSAIDVAVDRSVAGAAIRRLIHRPPRRRRARSAVYRLMIQPLLVGWFVARHPRLGWSVLRAVAGSPLPMWHRRVILGLFLRPAAAAPFLRARLDEGEVLIVEEGLVHRAVNLFAWHSGPVDHASVMDYLARVPTADVIVMVRARPDVCRARAERRGLPMRLRGQDDETIQRFMQNAAEITTIVATFLDRADASVVVVDNDDDPGMARDGLRAAVVASCRARLPTGPIRGTTVTTPRYDAARHPVVRRPDRASPVARSRRSHTPDADVERVLATFGLSATGQVRPVRGESRADNAIVPTQDGPKLVKRYKSSVDPSVVDHEHSVLRHLESKRFPAPRLNSAIDGRTVAQIGGRLHTVFDYEPGHFHFHEYAWLPRDRRRFVALSGSTLGALHTALSDHVPQLVHPLGFPGLDGPRQRGIDWYLAGLRQVDDELGDPSHGDPRGRSLWSEQRARRAEVEDRLWGLDTELEVAELPRQMIHGDFGPYNLLFKPGAPVMVLDFEMARLDWRLVDLAKATQQFAIDRFGLRRRRLDCFLSAYRRTTPLEPEEIRLLPSVWQFLQLRRVVACWTRFGQTGQSGWLLESGRKLGLADLPVAHTPTPPPTTG